MIVRFDVRYICRLTQKPLKVRCIKQNRTKKTNVCISDDISNSAGGVSFAVENQCTSLTREQIFTVSNTDAS